MRRPKHPASAFTAFVSLSFTTASIGIASAQAYSNWGFPPPTGVTLSAVSTDSGQVQISFASEPGLTYVVESSSDLVSWMPIATNSDHVVTRNLTLDASEQAQFYRVWRNPIPLLRWAVAANGNISMNGIGPATDGFNSADPNLSTDGQYDSSKFTSNGAVASVNGIVNLGNHTILGNLFLGPGATYSGRVDLVTGVIFSDANIFMPDVTLPPLTWWTAPMTNGVHDFTLTNTALHNSFVIRDSLPIQVEAGVQVILLVSNSVFSPGGISILGGSTNAGTLVVYQASGSASFLYGTYLGGGIRPTNFWYFGLPGVTNITITATANIGVFYAPEASVTANSGGLGPDSVGTLVAGSILMNGHYNFHFDESLLSAGPMR